MQTMVPPDTETNLPKTTLPLPGELQFNEDNDFGISPL